MNNIIRLSNVTFITCQYEKSVLTLHCIKSLRNQTKMEIPFTICDSSVGDKFNYDIPNIKILENYDNAHTSKSKDPSTRHCNCIEYTLSHINTDYVCLMDNDILFIKNPMPLLELLNDYDIIGQVVNCKFGKETQYKRLSPYFCLFNYKKVKENDIHYYRDGSIVTSQKDTGSSFYYDCLNKGFNFFQIDLNDYIIHLGHGSWQNQDVNKFLTENEKLYITL